jgi:glycosyltransferase involved in cell wall biosynthesis
MSGEPLRVIINDRILRAPRTGIGHYIAQLMARVPLADPAIRLFGMFWRPAPRDHKPAATAAVRNTAEQHSRRDIPPWLRIVVETGYQAAFRCVGSVFRCRLYHEPGHVPGPWGGITLTTIHDLSVLRFPQWHPPDRVRWQQRGLVLAAKRSTHFVAVSEFTKAETIKLLGVRPERVTVIHLGARETFQPRPANAVHTWLASRNLPPSYLLYVGAIEPRKNLPGLVEAYAGLPSDLRQRYPLLIAGGEGWGAINIEILGRRHGLSASPGHGAQLRLLGYQGDESLAMLYAGARALVWPTFYEGFGLPPLEAMASGTPVIASATGSLPEVVGDAGLLVNPNDPPAIRAAMQSVIEDDALAERLAGLGQRRATEFSWDRCAAAHAALYRRLTT